MIKTMEIIPPTNFDNALINEFKAMGIKEVYGKLPVDFFGGGRFASGLPNISRQNFVRHVKKLQDAGIGFNYILNSPCLASEEFTRTGRRKIKRFLDWLDLNGVKKVTVAIPYILQVVKDIHPDFKVCVSTYAQVNTYQKAKFWQDIQADEITLLDTSVNRNFRLLNIIRKGVSVKLRLIGNTGCLPDCSLFQYHSLLASHGSQSAYMHKAGFAVDYCVIYCKYLRLLNPVNFIRSQWIRPEDLGIYEEMGIDGIKLIDRRCSTDMLVKITKSYYEREYRGNLLDLLPTFHGQSAKSFGNFLLKLKYFFHPLQSDIFRIFRMNREMERLDIYIDNTKLDGFIRQLQNKDCDSGNCGNCGYCDSVLLDVVKYDKDHLKKMALTYNLFLSDIIKGKI